MHLHASTPAAGPLFNAAGLRAHVVPPEPVMPPPAPPVVPPGEPAVGDPLPQTDPAPPAPVSPPPMQ